MVQDESDAVILVVCRQALVGEVLRQLRSASTMSALPIEGVPAAVAESELHAPARSVNAVDGDRAIALLRTRHGLTDMQCVVLGLRFRGWTNARVAEAIGVEVGTIKAHVHAAKQRIGASSTGRVDALFRSTLQELADPSGDEGDVLAAAAWHQTLVRAARRRSPANKDGCPPEVT